MIRPGLAAALWIATAVLLFLNHTIGDTLIADRIGVRLALWYKTLLPIPYVALMAVIHARRTTGPAWRGAALLAGAMWSISTALFDALLGRLTYGESLEATLDRYGVVHGAPWPLLLVAQAVLPYAFGMLANRRKTAE